MENMNIYEQVRNVPPEACRRIEGGKLNGKTDINPMWRIKKLTELYGPCGIGWYYVVDESTTIPGANGEVAVKVAIRLFVKVDAAFSQPIYGVGGSMVVATEKGKLVTNDEAFKMATTDAISVACKQLGFGADVYWQSDRTKYTDVPTPESGAPKEWKLLPKPRPEELPFGEEDHSSEDAKDRTITDEEVNEIYAVGAANGWSEDKVDKAIQRKYNCPIVLLTVSEATEVLNLLSGKNQ